MTSLAKGVASVANVALQNVNTSLICDLERDLETLDQNDDQFSHILHRHTLTVWSFEEELVTTSVGRYIYSRVV
jgi:protein SERAC1